MLPTNYICISSNKCLLKWRRRRQKMWRNSSTIFATTRKDYMEIKFLLVPSAYFNDRLGNTLATIYLQHVAILRNALALIGSFSRNVLKCLLNERLNHNFKLTVSYWIAFCIGKGVPRISCFLCFLSYWQASRTLPLVASLI